MSSQSHYIKIRARERYINEVKQRIGEIPRKTLVLSSVLFIGGATLLTIGTICLHHCEEALGLFILGLIMILPGFYSMFILLNFVRGVRGYSWQQLPQTD
eukprot:TRINITY_DN6670_c0_g1_i1.p2 TRINITY_DN6670_c0_g1~~TRINITY_DN6670_c0_g1_i1.p2  ORF type:complete len:100 (-),score=23.35 TRINITY_DN6670_c0_g1_i1:49-348(-)